MADSAARRSILLGLIGDDIQRSLSPLFYEGEAARHGLAASYRLIDTKGLGLAAPDMARVLDALTLLGFRGANVTHPYKDVFHRLMSDHSDHARRIGAVNMILQSAPGCWTGHNTDWSGFLTSFRLELPNVAAASVAVIGAGGAGGAVAYAMLVHGAQELAILDLDHGRAASLCERLAGQFPDRTVIPLGSTSDLAGRVDGIVNASPVGMAGHPGQPVATEYLDPGIWVADIVLAPTETDLIAAARGCGCPVLNGIGMFVHQAAEAFRLYFGLQPDTARIEQTARRHFCRQAA